MERQIITTSGQLVLTNFLSQHPNANLFTILDITQQEGINKQSISLFSEYVTQNFQTFWEMLLIINVDETEENSKYPFILSEIIKFCPEQIFDYLFSQTHLELNDCISFLFQTLDRDYLEDTIAAYFQKFICCLIDQRGIELWGYLQINGKQIFEDLIKNINTNHIADIIYHLIALINYRGNLEFNYYQERLSLLNRIIDILSNKYYDLDIVENVCNILTELLKNVSEQNFKQLILEKICIPDTFFQLIFQTNSHSLVVLLNQLLYEIQQYTIRTQIIQPEFQFNYQQFELIGKNFCSALSLENKQSSFMSSYGVQQDILGQTKLQLIQFYYNILQTNNLFLINYFLHQEIYIILMKFIQKYEFNNTLQNYFLSITVNIFCNQNLVDIQRSLFDLNILGFLCFLNTQYYKQVGDIRKPITKGYQGVVNQLTFFFREISYTDEWNNYINNHQKILDIENNYLFGISPTEDYIKQEPNLIPSEEEKKEEKSQLVLDVNLSNDGSVNQERVRNAIQIAETNFQETNIREVSGEAILHQMIKKKKNISLSQGIISLREVDKDSKFLSQSVVCLSKSSQKRYSSSQEKHKNGQKQIYQKNEQFTIELNQK